MQIEFDVNPVSIVDFSNPWATEEKEEPKLSHLHEKIFSPPFYPIHMSKAVVCDYLHSLESKKTDTVVKEKLRITRNKDDNADAGGSFGVGARAKFGGSDGTQYEVYGKGEVHDDSGNYCEADVTVNDKGEVSAGTKAGHKSN